MVQTNINILELSLDIYFFREKISKTTIYQLTFVICRLPVT